MLRRRFVAVLTASVLLSGHRLAPGQGFPGKAIRLIVAFAPGGQSDLIARLVAQNLGPILGVNMIVENKPGAAGAIGVELAARATADGLTLLLGSASNLTIAPAIDRDLRYDPIRDFAPIGLVARLPLLLVVRSALPVTDVSQLVDYARKHPGELTYGSGATLVQFAIESLKARIGVDILQVPYTGSAPALVDLVAGRIDLLLADVAAVAPHAGSGAVRVIASAGKVRSRAFPAVPTMLEQGYDLVFESWHGLLAPAGVSAESILRLQAALRQVIASDEFRKGLEGLGAEPIDEPPAAFAPFLRNEIEKYRRLAPRTG